MGRDEGDITQRDAEHERRGEDVVQPREPIAAQTTELLECAAVAAILGISARGVRWMAETGRLPYYRTATGRRYYLRADVEGIAAERAARRDA